MERLTHKSVAQLSELLAKREISSEELTQAYYQQIEQKDKDIGAYLTLCPEAALAQARAVDEKRMKGEALSPLAGIPAGIKDNICTKGVRTTCASKILENFIPPYDATVMQKLAQEDMVMLGKLNMDEFAMGSSTENSHFQITHNPCALDRVPGGSSGGSAACIAADLAAYSLGSDTGGSIRQPAAFCGVVGMKPTYGRVSRYGLVAFASSLDQIGPVTRTVRDSAMVLSAIAGHDPKDTTSVNRDSEDYTRDLERGVGGVRIAMPKEYFSDGISQEVKQAVEQAAKQYEAMGAEIVETSLPTLDYALPAYYVLSSAEASSNLARFDGVRYGYRAADYEDMDTLYKKTRSEGFSSEVKRRIMLGSFVLSAGYYDAYYKKALQVRTLIVRDFAKIFERCDVILSPVAPTVAYKIGEKAGNPLEMYAGDICTVPVNIAGLPSLSLPCGKNAEGLPIGMQLIGPAFSEALLYQAANAYEQQEKGGMQA